jgi:hypothetical protein
MRKAVFILAAVAFTLNLPCSRAEDFWKKKGYREWSDKELQKMLNDSPWAKKASSPVQPTNTGAPDASMSGGGRSRGGGGMRGGTAGAEGGEASSGRMGGGGRGLGAGLTLRIQWASALPIKQAMVRMRLGAKETPSGELAQVLEREEPDYVVTVHNLPRRLASMEPARLKEALMKLARLDRKGKPSIVPSDIQMARTNEGGIIVAFVFPKSDPITIEDKDVHFVLKLGSTEFNCKFSLKDMSVNGKLLLSTARLLNQLEDEVGAVGSAEINPLCRLHEIRRQRFRYLHKLLRITIGQREPAALNLHHDPVALAEGVGDIGQIENDAIGFSGFERNRFFKTLPELAAERLAPNQSLIRAHGYQGLRRSAGRSTRCPSRIVVVGKIAGIDIDQLDIKIGVGSRCGDLQIDMDGTKETHVPVQHIGSENENVGARRSKTLILGHIGVRDPQ